MSYNTFYAYSPIQLPEMFDVYYYIFLCIIFFVLLLHLVLYLFIVCFVLYAQDREGTADNIQPGGVC